MRGRIYTMAELIATGGQEREWRPVADWEGVYEVSNFGEVRRGAPGTRGCGHLTRTSVAGAGYRTVRLTYHGRRARPYVHHLVLAAFVGPRPPGTETDHLNKDKTVNRLDNLAWKTHQQNCENR